MANSTLENNFFNVDNCHIPQYASSLSEFFLCYGNALKTDPIKGYIELLFVIATIVVNMFVYFMIYFRSVNWTVFDQALLGHCFIQLVTSILEIPFYHIYVGLICSHVKFLIFLNFLNYLRAFLDIFLFQKHGPL